jgi:hypothetical protein
MKRLIQERVDILSPEFIKRLRRDFLTLLKNLKRVKDYGQAIEPSKAIAKWKLNSEMMGFPISYADDWWCGAALRPERRAGT